MHLIRPLSEILVLGLVVARPARRAINIVQTQYGQVQGVESEYNPSITVYKGIPFAASTAGKKRWTAPEPPAPWSGVKVTDTFGPKCAQGDGPPIGKQVLAGTSSEDCLNLNIWTPKTSESTSQSLPVYVWIFGGRFMGGSASSPNFDGAGLAAKGIVVVAINYRLGVLGFLAHPELTAESSHNSSGNYGLLDQIAGLTWVKNNIAAFGGNPSQVTIGGQSAGASSVYHTVNSPLAAGLISGAVLESGVRDPGDPQISGLATSYRTLSTAEAQGVNYAVQLNASNIAAMRALDLAKLVANSGLNDDILGHPPLFRPVLDGYVVPRTYLETLHDGPANDVPILTGNDKDENGAAPTAKVTVAQYTSENRLYYGNFSDHYFQLYPGCNSTQAHESTNAAARDASRVGTWLWQGLWNKAAKSPVYTYYWDHAPPASKGRSEDTTYSLAN
jgi:carboxylesterase 2